MTVRRPSRFVAVLPVVAALVALGCVAAPRDRADPGSPKPAPVGSGRPAADIDGSRSVAEFRNDIGDAAGMAERYWRGHLAGSGEPFRPVSEIIAYRRADEVSCGGSPIGLNNAAYCSDGDFIAYDANWSLGAFRQVGDAFIFYLLGHEYAHAVQARLGIRKTFTIQQELQADCMAGALLGDSVRDRQLNLDDGDLDEFRTGLLAVGDDPGQPWFAEGAHGTATQRTQAFSQGYEQSLAACGLT